MDVLVVDLTHGGVIIALQLAKLKQFDGIYVYDIYNTLKKDEIHSLDSHNINIFYNKEDVSNYVTDSQTKVNGLLVVNPVHSYFNIFDIINKDIGDDNNNNTYIKEITHHQAVNLILKKWKKNIGSKKIPIIEVTGVKGKTSVVSMLKGILINKSPLVLSSLGAKLFKNKGNNEIILKKNISITPASILETVKLAKRIANPDCTKFAESIDSLDSIESIESYESTPDLFYGACIFENSLGATGLGYVGVLTNIAENYPIAKNTSNARNAKEQVFNCDIVVIEKETLEKYYSEKLDNGYKLNTFSFTGKNANLFVEEVKFDLNSTNIKIIYNNIKTKSGKLIDGYLDINTFALGKHHVSNVLATVTTALSCDIDEDVISKGLANFMGIKGRSSFKTQEKQIIIEEISPGINTKAIKSSIDMINNLKDYVVILGGKFGVTCEEIDEYKVANLLDDILHNKSNEMNKNIKESENNNKNKNKNKNINKNINKTKLNKENNEYNRDNNEFKEKNDFQLNNKFNLILTDDLGKEIAKKMENEVKFIKNPFEAQNLAIMNKKNVLFIYRSNYSQINKR